MSNIYQCPSQFEATNQSSEHFYFILRNNRFHWKKGWKLPSYRLLLGIDIRGKVPEVGDEASRKIWYFGEAVAEGGGAPGGVLLMDIPEMCKLWDLKSSITGSIPGSIELQWYIYLCLGWLKYIWCNLLFVNFYC